MAHRGEAVVEAESGEDKEVGGDEDVVVVVDLVVVVVVVALLGVGERSLEVLIKPDRRAPVRQPSSFDLASTEIAEPGRLASPLQGKRM